MNPASIDAMSWEMAEVYGAITDQIVINLAHYFPYLSAGKHPPKSMFDYQAAMLAQMGKINAQTMQIIRNNLSDADRALSASLETAIADAIKDSEPALYRGAKAGIFMPPTKPVLSANQTRAFGLYYKQAADKLNLVNTVMLESTQSAYMQTVSNVISEYEILERLNRTQIALDVAAGETITGVSSWNTAVRHATQRMKDGGITGFVDHAGRHWDAETYVAMDIRTTMFNTGRAAVWETNEGFGNDLYIVSYHNGARPLCYDWQNKVISANNVSRDVADLDGNPVHVYAQNETTYGEPAGLFGINCKHYPTPFVPGVSVVRGQVQDKAENDKQYAESQKQRALERNLREQKRDLEMMKAQGADEDIIRAQREKVRAASKEIDDFCDETGRVRRRNREAVYTKRDFPSGNYDPSQFAREQQKRFDDYWKNGGTQSGFTFGQLVPNVPIPVNPKPAPVPPTPAAPVAPVSPVVPTPTPAQNVAPQATNYRGNSEIVKAAEQMRVKRRPVARFTTQPTETEIIERLAGADKTKGSCSSVALAYCGNKSGLDVLDFRGGDSQYIFAKTYNIEKVINIKGINGIKVTSGNDFTNAHNLMSQMLDGHEYYFTAGKHAAIVRKTATGFEYLEMQSGWRKNTWYALDDFELRRRFGCQRSHTTYGMKYETSEFMFDVDAAKGNKDFAEMLEFINTAEIDELKGLGGGEK